MRIKDSGKIGIGTAAPGARLTVTENAVAAPSPLSGTVTQLVAANSTAARAESVSFASSGQFAFRRSEGSAASPSGTGSGRRSSGRSPASAMTGRTGRPASNVAVQLVTAEAWSTSARGTKLRLQTTPIGSTTLATVITVADDGSLQMGSAETTVIDGNRHFRPRQYAAASLPSQDSGDVIASSDIVARLARLGRHRMAVARRQAPAHRHRQHDDQHSGRLGDRSDSFRRTPRPTR